MQKRARCPLDNPTTKIHTTVKLPKETAEGAFQIGEKKYALFVAMALIPVDEHEQQSGVLYRSGEVSCLSIALENAEAPIDMETAPMIPGQLPAETLEAAAAQLGEELKGIADRILKHEAVEKIRDDVASRISTEKFAAATHGKFVNETPAPEGQAQE